MLRLIQKMKPKPKEQSFEDTENELDKKADGELNRKLFPGLAIPDNPNVRVSPLVTRGRAMQMCTIPVFLKIGPKLYYYSRNKTLNIQ